MQVNYVVYTEIVDLAAFTNQRWHVLCGRVHKLCPLAFSFILDCWHAGLKALAWGVTSGRTVSPDWHQHMWAFTPLPLAPAWPCLGWPQQPLGKLLQPSPAEKEVVSFRGFALGQLPLVRQLYLNL